MSATDPAILQCISPVDGRVYAERALATSSQIALALDRAERAQVIWRETPLVDRQAITLRAIEHFVSRKSEIAEEISWQMGRPIAYSPGEVSGFEERARFMLEIADEALADVRPEPKQGFIRFIRRDPLGVVFVIAPWNYPYLTAVNSVVPAILAGNAVLLKHSSQTPLCSERMSEAFSAAGLPDGVLQHLHLSHDDTVGVIGHESIAYVAFTGSVEGGQAIQRATSQRFIGSGLELGGKDPAYVRADADLESTVPSLVDGSFFNSGQSCCGVERIYVDTQCYDDFVESALHHTRQYRLGDPLDEKTTLGPMVRAAAADFVRGQIGEAVESGARALVETKFFEADEPGTAYLAPQVLVDVDHSMSVMMEESFGPVVGIMRVESDEEAVSLMNDSRFGLTASIWSADVERATELGGSIETGTVFLNRCDYLDPALAWTGVKHSGRGVTLSRLGYEVLTRPKSFHLREPSRSATLPDGSQS
jgi:acyl-CoA reductase-like NAD-dependent aldehyde dehydrogenase